MDQQRVLQLVLKCAADTANIRAVVLTGSMALGPAHVHSLSDMADLDACWSGFGGAQNAQALLRSMDLFERLLPRTAERMEYAPFDANAVRADVRRILPRPQRSETPTRASPAHDPPQACDNRFRNASSSRLNAAALSRCTWCPVSSRNTSAREIHTASCPCAAAPKRSSDGRAGTLRPLPRTRT
jgi:hypothetical protein